MAWSGTEGFESYADEASLSNGAGGSGWSANWVLDLGTFVAEADAPSPPEGSKVARMDLDGSISRTFTSVTDGRYRIRGRFIAGTTKHSLVRINEGATSRFIFPVFNANTAGQTSYWNGAYVNVAANAADTWYKFEAEFDVSTDQFRWAIDDGADSAWISFNGTAAGIDKLAIEYSSGGNNNSYWDDIANEAAAAATAYKSNLSLLGIG